MSATQEKSDKQVAYEKFENVFKNTLIEQILGHAKKYKLPAEYLTYFEKVGISCHPFLVTAYPRCRAHNTICISSSNMPTVPESKHAGRKM